MASNLSCIGLEVNDQAELGQLIAGTRRSAQEIGVFDGVRVERWVDDSGATLILGWRSKQLVDLTPAYAATRGGMLSDCHLINEQIASAAVVDTDGEQLTAMAFDAEQYREMKALTQPLAGPARITALGVSVEVHADATAFAASPDSLLDPAADPAQEPPPHYRERGWQWPPRIACESFISHGIFGDPDQATAHARMSGTVLEARHQVCVLTGQPFTVAAVQTAGFEAEVCLSASEHPTTPEPGNIISGTVFLVAAIDAPALTTP
jgi:hypothetical protein